MDHFYLSQCCSFWSRILLSNGLLFKDKIFYGFGKRWYCVACSYDPDEDDNAMDYVASSFIRMRTVELAN